MPYGIFACQRPIQRKIIAKKTQIRENTKIMNTALLTGDNQKYLHLKKTIMNQQVELANLQQEMNSASPVLTRTTPIPNLQQTS